MWVVWSAPVLMAELLVDAAIAGGLYRRMRGMQEQGWWRVCVTHTIWPLLGLVLFFAVLCWVGLRRRRRQKRPTCCRSFKRCSATVPADIPTCFISSRSLMRQRIARKRILTTAVVLFVAAGAALMASVRPQWRQDVSPPPINLGTARMQAEVMAELIDLRPTPPGKPPGLPIPMKAVSSPMLTGNSGFATAEVPLADVAPAHFEPPGWEPDVPFAVMEWTAPSCGEGDPVPVCQVRHNVVEWRDDDSAASIQLQQHLEAMLQVANRRAVRVPDLAFELAHVRAQRMTWDELQQRRARGVEGCTGGPGNPDLGVVYLQRPVFSMDGNWAMASVASDLCSGGTGMRDLYLLHRGKDGWERVRVEPVRHMSFGHGLWPALPES